MNLDNYVSSTLSKWQKTMNVHWTKTQSCSDSVTERKITGAAEVLPNARQMFKTEWEGLFLVTPILSDLHHQGLKDVIDHCK